MNNYRGLLIYEVKNSVIVLKKWLVSDGLEFYVYEGYLLRDVIGNRSRYLCCFGFVLKCLLFVVDVLELWFEVVVNNSRLLRYYVNYILVELV